MSIFFDSHAHFDDSRFEPDRHSLLEGLKGEGVDNIINVGADLETSKKSIELAEKYDFVYAAVGVHPHDTRLLTEQDESRIIQLANHPKVVAIGEIGLDFHYDNSPRNIQQQWFERQLEIAKQLDYPVIIHDRESRGKCVEVLKNSGWSKGVMHCFSGSVETAKTVLELGFYISIAGPVTYKNNVRTVEVVKYLPMDRILIETDCPYLSPEPHRGKRNYSAYVKHVAEKIAQIKGMSIQEVAQATAQNTKQLFGKIG